MTSSIASCWAELIGSPLCSSCWAELIGSPLCSSCRAELIGSPLCSSYRAELIGSPLCSSCWDQDHWITTVLILKRAIDRPINTSHLTADEQAVHCTLTHYYVWFVSNDTQPSAPSLSHSVWMCWQRALMSKGLRVLG